MTVQVGFVLGSTLSPEHLPAAARALDAGGFSTIWMSEDYFFTGGVSGAAIALGATERIAVGIGLLPIYVRHPALSAMEASTLAGAFPGRFIVGFGSGVKNWLDQIGIVPSRPLGVMRETIGTVRALLAGETLDATGTFVFRDVRLTYPPEIPPPVYVGATGPKMMELAGELADGVLISVLSTPEFVRAARETVDRMAPEGRRPRITAFAIFSMADTVELARARARPAVASYLSHGANQLTDAAGISERLTALLAEVGREGLEKAMPDEWMDRVSVCGDAAACRAAIEALIEAGADEVGLMPVVPGSEIVPHIVEAGSLLGLAADA